jgi:hypothetical protein
MLDVTFTYPGVRAARVMLFEQDKNKSWDHARAEFNGNAQTCVVSAEPPEPQLGNFRLRLDAYRGKLPSGVYRFRIQPELAENDTKPAGGWRTAWVYFDVTWGGEDGGDSVRSYSLCFAPPTGSATPAVDLAAVGSTDWSASLPVRPARPVAPQEEPRLTHDGVTRTVPEWGRLLGLAPMTIYMRLADGCTVEQALAVAKAVGRADQAGGRAGRAIEF